MTSDEKYYISQTMIKLGGNFVQHLGRALAIADSNNTRRIEEAFPEYIREYKKLSQQIKW